MADDTTKPSKPGLVFDVSHPGTVAPSATTKEIVTNNHIVLKDPMMADPVAPQPAAAEAAPLEETSGASEPTELAQAPLPKQTRIVIKPLHDNIVPEKTVTAPVAITPAAGEEPVIETAAPESIDTVATTELTPKTESAPVSQPDAIPAEPAAPTEAVAEEPKPVDTPIEPDPMALPKDDNPALQNEKDIDEAVNAENERQAGLQKLIDTKEFFLPINNVEKQKAKQFVILGIFLAIVLAAAWADVALDSGIIHIGGIKPVTHFFSN